MNKILTDAPMFALHNRTLVEESEVCGCYHCLAVFSKHDITQWTDDHRTALCPACSVDAVVPQTAGVVLDADTLRSVQQHWFGKGK